MLTMKMMTRNVKMMSRNVTMARRQGLLAILAMACAAFSHAAAPALSAKKLQPAVAKYLQEKGDFCLGKFDWPISVSDAESRGGSNNALQMPVLEKLGLVASVPMDGVGGKTYSLTEEGRKYYRVKKTITLGPADKPIEHPGDFCAAKLSLDKVVAWEPPTVVDGRPQTSVKYTYKADAAPWTQDPDIKKVFPMIARIVGGAGSMQLVQVFAWSNNAWVAVTPGG